RLNGLSTAPGDRAARPAATVDDAAFARTRQNWIPTGPRNFSGRIVSLAIHPTNPDTMYAGAASGGVFKSLDGGETWVSQWFAQPSLAVGALGICRDHPETVYAGTGEVYGGLIGNGVYRTDNGGALWTNPMAVVAPGDPPVPGTK